MFNQVPGGAKVLITLNNVGSSSERLHMLSELYPFRVVLKQLSFQHLFTIKMLARRDGRVWKCCKAKLRGNGGEESQTTRRNRNMRRENPEDTDSVKKKGK